ncbi:MAG: type IX secretion system sortase PorU [Crocinitomicaceae bacterium]|nr:type IX secretion system sortase PorU [Crocinitomicaceae bacterium]
MKKYFKLSINNQYIVFIFFFCIFSTYSQNAVTISINWSEPTKTTVNNIVSYVPNFEGQIYYNDKIYFQYMEEVAAKYDATFSLVSFQTESATQNEINYLKNNHIEITNESVWNAKVSNGGRKRLLVFSIVPYILQNGTIQRISSFTFNRQAKAIATTNLAKSYATESVLKPGSGKWYKISVTQDGIYKIDKQFLSKMGIDVANLNPQHINIYGNGDGLLPEKNSDPRTDDLAVNAIYVVGEADGKFDDTDYILFYAKGPHQWKINPSNTNTFINNRNLYSDISCYFININSATTPVRMQNMTSSVAVPTNTITSYSFRDVYENDWTNVTKCGQRWYGELFDTQLSYTFNFNVPNPVIGYSSLATISMASSSLTSASGTIAYTINGSQLENSSVPSQSDGYYGRSTKNFTFNNNNSTIGVNIKFNRNNPSAVAYLDKIEINTRRHLVFYGNQFTFRDLESVGAGNIGEFIIQQFPTNGFVWDVTNRQQPKNIIGTNNAGSFSYRTTTDDLREFVASDGTYFFTPNYIGEVYYQNLHSLPQVDYLIITHPDFTSQANRLADLHRNNGLSVHVVNINEVYNEFSSGAVDAGAIRAFIKMFYDRSTSASDNIKYVCLFGDGTYDPKNRISGNNNFIPTYQILGSNSTESPIGNIAADDFYGLLDNSDAVDEVSVVDVGIGRILVSSLQIAQEQVNKIEHYMKGGSNFYTANNVNCVDGVSSSSFGDWRSKLVNVGDLEDYFVLTDLEPIYNTTKVNHPEINVNKLYLDAYKLESTAAGNRFPTLNEALLNSFYSGSLIINYVGHGSVLQLSESRVLTTAIIKELKNSDRLPLFISATCEFTRFDDPSLVSAGEWMTLNPIGGAIAMMTTTRTVSYSINSNTISAFFGKVFDRTTAGSPQTFGDIILNTKTSQSAASLDKTAFILIGDPALKIALPEHKIVIDSINGVSPNNVTDTIQALSKVRVKAHLEDYNGNLLSSFNGIATPSLYDKPKQLKTLGQKPGPSTIGYANEHTFELQKNIIYRGQSTVKNGQFTFEFIVPKDIDYSYGNGKFSLYADNKSLDAIGVEQRVIVGGVNPLGLNDEVGPEIKIYLNNENFVNGGITDETPYLIAKLSDENGINTVGNGIGHDITVIIDGETSSPIVLNDYFKNDLDSYQTGELRYQLSKLEPGRHTLTLKVWDVNNNSSEETIDFIVQEKSELKLDHVLNYPNPFTTSTEFFFEHNQCCTELETQIQIFTISGKLVKTINQTIYTQGYRSNGIHWDGMDDFGDKLARGVYIYRLKVRTPTGEIAEKLEKLVLL